MLRMLQNNEAICLKNANNENDDDKFNNYTCTVQIQILNIKQVKIIPGYNFTSQNVDIVGVSPFAHTFMDNIQNVGEGETDFSKVAIYILEHSKVEKYDNLLFNISGMINGTKPNFTFIDLSLKINALIEDNYEDLEVNCTIIDINDNNYTLNCGGKKDVLYDLQGAVSITNNELLVINFDNDTNSEVIFNSFKKYYKLFSLKKNGGLTAGAIVGIIVPFVAVLSAVIILMIYDRRRKNDYSFDESTIKKLK